MKRSAKFTPPIIFPIGGMMMSLTTEATILPNAPPMMTPTAMSITFPRNANALNSCNMLIVYLVFRFPADPFLPGGVRSLRQSSRR